jgi:phage terminase large subunit
MSWRRYRPYSKGEFYVVGADTAWTGIDYVAAQFLCKTSRDVPVVYHTNKVSMTLATQALHAELEKIYDHTGVKPVVAIETNNGGTGWLETLSLLNRNGKYIIYRQKKNQGTSQVTEESDKLGYSTNTATRPKMLGDLKEAIDGGLIDIYDKPTVTEMFSFIVGENGKPQAETGAHDDLIMALAIAWQLYQSENPIEPIKHNRPAPRRLHLHVR